MPTLLVHGGTFAGSCWERLVPLLRDEAVAMDLPGRGTRPADLRSITLADFVDAAVSEVERLGDDVLVVGHSMAGATIPGVIARVGERLRGVVLVSCTVPVPGTSAIAGLGVEGIDLDEASIEAAAGDDDALSMLDPATARAVFFNDMDDETAAYATTLMVPEAPRVVFEKVDTSPIIDFTPKLWVRLTGDAILSPDRQTATIARLGPIDVVDLDAGHMAMISAPEALAAILDGR